MKRITTGKSAERASAARATSIPARATPAPDRAAPAIPRPQLEVRDLELVLALARARTTAAGAAALHISQSAVSRALAQTEDRLGTRLFDRASRGLTPTVAGRRLIDGAGLVLAELRNLEQHVSASTAASARVRIVSECYTAYRWVPSALMQLQTSLPGLELELAVEHTDDPVGALAQGEIDVALLTTATVPAHAGFFERSLFSDEIVFVVSGSHPLAKRRFLTRADLRAHPLLTSNTPAAEARWFMKSVFGRHQPKLNFRRLPLTEAIMDAARAGMGIAVLSEWMASSYLGGGDLLAKRFTTGPLRRPWRIAYRKDVAELGERLADALANSMPRLYAARAS